MISHFHGGTRRRLFLHRRLLLAYGVTASLSVAFFGPATAAPAEETVITLPAIDVRGPGEGQGSLQGSLTAPDNRVIAAGMARQAGAVTFVDGSSFASRSAATMRDVLKDTPGVLVQERYGQEQRIAIRGSGMARSYHLRGLEILQDGAPVNAADGSGDLYQIDPVALRGAEVWRGGNALRFGATTLGGAVNVISATARTVATPHEAGVEAGADGFLRNHVRTSYVSGRFDMLASVTLTNADGARDHAVSIYRQFNANFGWRVSDSVETRFYAGYYDTRQKLPGSLSLFDALHTPHMATRSAVTGNQSRDVTAFRIANVTSVRLDAGQLDLATWAIHKTMNHPIFQVLAQDGWNWGVSPRLTTQWKIAGMDSDLVAGARLTGGSTDARQYENIAGRRGALTTQGVQDALNMEAYAENSLWVLPDLALVTGVKAFNSLRAYSQPWNAAQRPGWADRRDTARYAGTNLKVGALWRVTPDIQIFANLTRSVDVPDFTDLTQTFAGSTNFTRLRAQRAWTAEAGSRGVWGALSWEATLYKSRIRDEMLAYTVNPSIPANVFNAPRTVHQGVELAASIDLFQAFGENSGQGSLVLRQSWTLNDFHFKRDPVYGNNVLAGAPRHVLRTTLTWKRPDGLFIAPSVDWVPSGAWVDYANTLKSPGYALLGLEAGYQPVEGLNIFIDARNLANRRYVSDLAVIANASSAQPSALGVFYPGGGRTVRAGARYAF